MEYCGVGQLNRATGWGLLLAGLGVAATLDPWIMGATDSSTYAEGLRPIVRHAQGVTLAMAFLQLAMGYVLALKSFSNRVGRLAEWLSVSGAVLYSLGYGLGVFWHSGLTLVVCGSALNLAAFFLLAYAGPSGEQSRDLRLGLCVVCFGMTLDLLGGLAAAAPDLFLPDYLGAVDGLRLRMFRLARVAAIALCVLTLLCQQLANQDSRRRPRANWGGFLLLCGAIGMPSILAMSALSWTGLKYALTLPATATMIGVSVAAGIAWRRRCALERAGWTMIAASLAAGLLMGCYAFDGPFPTPEFLGGYNEYARRISRLAHSYSIVLGMLAIFVARGLPWPIERTARQRLRASLVISGGVAAILMLLIQVAGVGSLLLLAVGPIVAAVGVLMCIVGQDSS